MSVRVIIDCSWLLVVCTISPEGKRRMHMNQEGLLSMAVVFLSLSESLTATLRIPKKIPVMSLEYRKECPEVMSTRAPKSDIAYTLHHPWPHVSLHFHNTFNNALQYPLYQERGKRSGVMARNLAKKYKVYGVGLFDFDWFRIALHCIIWHGIMFAVFFYFFA